MEDLPHEENLWGSIDLERWRETPCVVKRLATVEDVQTGHAVFYVENPSETDSNPIDLDLPRWGLLTGENGDVSPVILVQAERHSVEKVLIGYRPLDGGNGICTIDEVAVLDGPDGRFLGFPGLSLTLESGRAHLAPTLSQVHAAVDSLTPSGGPGYFVLETSVGDYTQVAGGDGAFTAEWREYSGGEFRHWVAGLIDRPTGHKIGIATNGASVTVKENECLSAIDVKAIMDSFVRDRKRPSRFTWRDISDRFR